MPNAWYFESTKCTLFNRADLICCGRSWQECLLGRGKSQKDEIFEEQRAWEVAVVEGE